MSEQREIIDYSKIGTFREGAKVKFFAMIQSAETKSASSGSMFLNTILSDNTGSIKAILWDVPPEMQQGFKAEDIVRVIGSVDSYMGSLQIKIKHIEKVLPGEIYDIRELIQSAPFEGQAMYNSILKNCIEPMTDENLKKLTGTIFDANREKLLYYPASDGKYKVMRGGLLYHIYNMSRMAKTMTEIYPEINKDLLYAGVVLHEIGKLSSLTAGPHGTIKEVTERGNYIGSAIESIKIVEKAATMIGIPEDSYIAVEHLILSQQPEGQYDKPLVEAQLPEAILLRKLDSIDMTF